MIYYSITPGTIWVSRDQYLDGQKQVLNLYADVAKFVLREYNPAKFSELFEDNLDINTQICVGEEQICVGEEGPLAGIAHVE